MKRDFDITGAEEKIGAHFRSLRRSVKDPGSIRINNTEKAKEKKTAGLPLQLAGAFLAAAIVGGGTFTAFKMMERHGNVNQAVGDTSYNAAAVTNEQPENEKMSAVRIDLNAFPPPSEDGAAKVFTVFSNDKITVRVEDDGRCYAMPKESLSEFMFTPGVGEKVECYAVWVNSGNGFKDTLLFVDCADGAEALYALDAGGDCVKVTDTEKLRGKYGGDYQPNILLGIAPGGSPMFSYRALTEGHTLSETWDVWIDFSVVNANGKLKAVRIMGEEVMKYLSSHDFFGLSFYAYGQAASLKPYMLWTEHPDSDGTYVSADGPGAAGAEYGDIPVIYGEYGVSPDISFDLSRIKCDAFVYPLGYEGSVYEYDAEKALREFDGDEITLVLRVTFLTGSSSAARDTFSSFCCEYPVRIKFVRDSVPQDEQIVIEMTDEDILLFSRIACTPHFTVRMLISTQHEDIINPAHNDKEMLQALFNVCSGKKAVAAVPECEPDFEITLSVDGVERYVIRFKMGHYLNGEAGIVTFYTAGCGEVIGTVTLSNDEEFGIDAALGLVDG